MHHLITIYDWPWSQKCMECKHGEFIDSEKFSSSCYLCHIRCEENDGVDCPYFEEKGSEL
jgi:hypothetical protein